MLRDRSGTSSSGARLAGISSTSRRSSEAPKGFPPLQALSLALRVAAAAGLLAYLGMSGTVDWWRLERLARVWPITLAALLVLLADMAVTAWRLCVLLRPRGLRLSFGASFRLTLIGAFFNVCLPGATGGDVIRIYYATAGQAGRRTEVATVILMDRAVGMFALMLCPLIVAPLFLPLVGSLDILRGLLVAAVAACAVMLAAISLSFSGWVQGSGGLGLVVRKLPLGRYVQKILGTLASYREHRSALAAAVGISLLAHSLAIGTIMLLVRAITGEPLAWELLLVVPLGMIANALPLTPGGLGVGEAALSALFAMVNLRGGAEALVGWRVLMILIGIPGLVFYLAGRTRILREAGPTPAPAWDDR